ncbi:MAG: metallophosphoesterase [bacterium]
MQIAVTADLHLSERKKYPERYRALELLLDTLLNMKINQLIIAGDLFDQESHNYKDFDSVCSNIKYKNIQFHIIPGNHDPSLQKTMLSSENTRVYSSPEFKQFDLMSMMFFFLPYTRDKTMGECIAKNSEKLDKNKWILISHGDWIPGMSEPNPWEPGIYMPLTRSDIEQFRPAQVICGHIHKPIDSAGIHYPGSLCGLDINETGKRRFLTIDSETGSIASFPIYPDIIYFNESITVLPVQDEEKYLQNQIKKMVDSWEIPVSEKNKIRLRLRVSGYSKDKNKLFKLINQELKDITFHDHKPDLSQVYVSDDLDREEITKQVYREIENLHWPEKKDEPDKDRILLHALRVIYEE